MTPAQWLRARAESYSTDAGILRRSGQTDDALVYEAIRDELRKCAEECPRPEREPQTIEFQGAAADAWRASLILQREGLTDDK